MLYRICRRSIILSYVFITVIIGLKLFTCCYPTLLQSPKAGGTSPETLPKASCDIPALYFSQRPSNVQNAAYSDHSEVDSSAERPSGTVERAVKLVTKRGTAKDPAVELSWTDLCAKKNFQPPSQQTVVGEKLTKWEPPENVSNKDASVGLCTIKRNNQTRPHNSWSLKGE